MAAGAVSFPLAMRDGTAEGDSGNAVASRAWKGERPVLPFPLRGTRPGVTGQFPPESSFPFALQELRRLCR
jgi:hypothetical protein